VGFVIFSNLFFFISLLLIFIFLLFTVAFFTLAERKLMAAIQRRKGPDVVGFWGFLQPLADGLKLLFKEIIFPYRSLKFLFLFSPMLIFSVSLIIWIVLPLSTNLIFSSIYYSILFTFILASLNVYGLILSGWASNSRYAFLGSIRAAAQMISYELIFGIINLIIIFCCNSCNYIDVILIQKNNWFIFLLLPIFLFFLIIILAETNRTPFDLAEAEAELVAGYNLEYSSIIFALFFLGEYSNMLFLSVLGACYFFGGSFFFF
jgi:NADH-quinone oxidoreductase subunit H